MFAILHAFLLWHESWPSGSIRLACDNTAVVDAINNKRGNGPTITIYSSNCGGFRYCTIRILDSISREHGLTSQTVYQDVDLAPEAKYLLHHSFAPATRRSYNSARGSYESLCRSHDYVTFPA